MLRYFVLFSLFFSLSLEATDHRTDMEREMEERAGTAASMNPEAEVQRQQVEKWVRSRALLSPTGFSQENPIVLDSLRDNGLPDDLISLILGMKAIMEKHPSPEETKGKLTSKSEPALSPLITKGLKNLLDRLSKEDPSKQHLISLLRGVLGNSFKKDLSERNIRSSIHDHLKVNPQTPQPVWERYSQATFTFPNPWYTGNEEDYPLLALEWRRESPENHTVEMRLSEMDMPRTKRAERFGFFEHMFVEIAFVNNMMGWVRENVDVHLTTLNDESGTLPQRFIEKFGMHQRIQGLHFYNSAHMGDWVFSQLPSLQKLGFFHGTINPLMKRLLNDPEFSPRLSGLHLHSGCFKDMDPQQVSSFFAHLPNLQKLDLNYVDMRIFSSILRENALPHLTHLRLTPRWKVDINTLYRIVNFFGRRLTPPQALFSLTVNRATVEPRKRDQFKLFCQQSGVNLQIM